MTECIDLPDLACDICGSHRFLPVDFTSYAMPTRSSKPSLHDYVNHICAGCGVITPYPQPDNDALAADYAGSYRRSPYAVTLADRTIEPPIQMPWSGVSFARFQSFYDAVTRHAPRLADIVPTGADSVLDYGAYQGLFLYGAKQAWGCNGIAYDYSPQGIAFARDALGFKESVVAKDIYSDLFRDRPRFVVLIQAFEHLQYPTRFLQHVHDNVIAEDGFLYIEVPSAFGFPLSDPHHFYTYHHQNIEMLLAKCGFEVVETWYDGHPATPEYMWYTKQQNLHCLARRVDKSSCTPPTPSLTAVEVRARIRREFRRHSFAWAARQSVLALRMGARALYHLAGAVLIDGMPVGLQKHVDMSAALGSILHFKSRVCSALRPGSKASESNPS